MSASSRIIRYAAANRAFLTGARALPRSSSIASSAYTAHLRHNYGRLPGQMPISAIVAQHRYVNTQTHDPSGGPAGPPPGFNTEKAKRPLSESEKESKSSEKPADSSMDAETVAPVPRTEATAVPKTDAVDALSLSELVGQKGKEKDKALEANGLSVKKEEKKLTILQKIQKEVMHYWDGTKLLATEVRISTRLAFKMAAGYELSRREHRQLQRTVQDLARLIPFSVFIIVPFAELLLPVALRLFPNLLPSTYEGQKSKDTKASNLRQTRKEVSSFLRQTLKETGLPLSAANAQKEDFTNFFRKLRATGEQPTAEDVIKVCKLFKDDLTLDNLSRPQLVSMAQYLNLNSYGTDVLIRYQIRHRMRQIKRDDKAIAYEGVDSLSVAELQMAASSRGIRTYGTSPARLREDLQAWLDLRLKHGIPSALLVLSNAFMYGSGKEGEASQIDALTTVMSSFTEELFHEVELEVHNAEGAATNKQRLEVLKEQQELIEEENEQTEDAGQKSPRDMDNIDEKEEHNLATSTGDDSAQVREAAEAEADASMAKEVAKEESKPDNNDIIKKGDSKV